MRFKSLLLISNQTVPFDWVSESAQNGAISDKFEERGKSSGVKSLNEVLNVRTPLLLICYNKLFRLESAAYQTFL